MRNCILLFLRDVLASIGESTKLLLKLKDNDSIVVLFPSMSTCQSMFRVTLRKRYNSRHFTQNVSNSRMYEIERQRNYPTVPSIQSTYLRSVRPTRLTNHRCPYGPSAKYLEEGVRGSGRGRLTNALRSGDIEGRRKETNRIGKIVEF